MRVLIVDDHDVIFMGLYHVLSREGCLLTHAKTYEEAVCRLQKECFDTVVVDLSLVRTLGESEEISVGFELLGYIKQNVPNLPTIVVTGIQWSQEPRYLFFAERAGAMGYFCKDSILHLIQGLKTLCANRPDSLYSAEQCQKILAFIRKRPLLTCRERAVIRCLDQGLPHKEIAAKLCVSTTTIKTHLRNIYAKLQVSDTYGALKEGRHWGYLEQGWLRDQ
ncbi:MAG: response regulator transcription factor [Ardenticatenales bacterium]|nr:response regulator transcription factor [Ardenticatenales bacterium]